MTKRQRQRRDHIDEKERQQRAAVIAEFAASDADATLQAMVAEVCATDM